MLEHLLAGQPLERLRNQKFGDKILSRVADFRPGLALKGIVATLDLREKLVVVAAVKGHLTGEKDEGHHAKAPAVARSAVGHREKDLGRDVRGRAAIIFQKLVILVLLVEELR